MHSLFLICSPKNNVSESIRYLKMPKWRWQYVAFIHQRKFRIKRKIHYCITLSERAHVFLHREAPLLSFGIISSCCWRPGIAPRGRLATTVTLRVLCLPVQSQLTLCFPSCGVSCGRIALQNRTLTWLGLSGKEEVSGFVNKVRLLGYFFFS